MKRISLGLVMTGLIAGLAACGETGTQATRDEIKVAGSSTVLPYAQIVADNFQEDFRSENYSVTVEGGGSSAGLKQFCAGLGPTTIDIANASRAMKPAEVEACAEAGVDEIIEIQFGYDGIVFASDVDGPSFALEPRDVYLALATQVPVDGEIGDNPYETWAQINPALPDWPIEAYIPGEKHGTREVFEEKVIIEGCRATGAIELHVASGKSEDAAEAACTDLDYRRAIDVDGEYTETLSRLEQSPQAIGVFGLSFYENNVNRLRVATMSGVTPTAETVASGEYPVSRPLFFYVKVAHIGVIPGLDQFVTYFLSEQIAGPGGPLADYGLVPAPENERAAMRQRFENRETL